MKEIKKLYKLFLDDIRYPEDAFHYTFETMFNDKDWVIVRNYKSFIFQIQKRFKNGEFPSIIAFDHDLADIHYNQEAATETVDWHEKNGYHCAVWLCDFCMDNDLKLPDYYVHSMNPTGKINIQSYLDNYRKNVEYSV